MRLLPKEFIHVQAYLLEEGVPPLMDVVIGLRAIKDNVDLYIDRTENYFTLPDGNRIQLRFLLERSTKYPQLITPRLRVTVFFEPSGRPSHNSPMTQAIVDTGAPYVIIPYSVHKYWSLRLYSQDNRLYGGLYVGQRKLQSFCEIGLKFCTS